MIIRNSEVTDFLRCRLRWHYRWYRQLEPKKKSTKLVLGTLFHRFLESYYSFQMHSDHLTSVSKLDFALGDMKEMFDAEVASKIADNTYDGAEAGELWAFLEDLADWYHAYWSERQVHTWEIVATEQTYYINMTTLAWTTDRSAAEESSDVWYECTLDLVLRINGKLYIADHKTVSRLEDFIKKTEMDRQISRYLFAAHVIFKGEEIHGLIYNLIKKELPHPPKETKNGLSVAKDQRTTYNLYLDALIAKGLATTETNEAGETTFTTSDQYMGMLQILKDKELPNGQGNDWMRRVVVKRNVHEMNNAMNELMQVALTIQRMSKFLFLKDREGTDLGHNNPIYRTINDNCSWDCGYKSMCIAGMDGSDVRYLEDEFLMPVTTNYETDGEA